MNKYNIGEVVYTVQLQHSRKIRFDVFEGNIDQVRRTVDADGTETLEYSVYFPSLPKLISPDETNVEAGFNEFFATHETEKIDEKIKLLNDILFNIAKVIEKLKALKGTEPKSKNDIDEKLKKFIDSQEELGPEFAKVLNKNLWELYE